MKRRDLLRTLGGLGSMSILGLTTDVSASQQTLSSRGFSDSFTHFREHLGPSRIRFDRPLPAELEGTLYRNGPALMQRGTTRYQHWFDGDGMIQSFHLQGQTLTHRAKVVQTDKYTAEAEAGEFLWSSFGTALDDSISPQKPDDVNVANISVLPLGDELLALWEAGSPWRIDPDTLDTKGRKVFSSETDGLPFSAHPRVDPDGRIWNFGYVTGRDQLVLYELAPSGSLKRVSLVDTRKTNMVHDFAMTDKYLIFALMPIDFSPPTDRGIPSFLSMLEWNNESSVDIVVIDKETLSIVQRTEIPPFFAFHFGNAWQEGNQLRVETAVGPEFHGLMKQIEQATIGQSIVSDLPVQSAMDIVIDLTTGSVRTENLPLTGADFPCFDERFAGKKTNTLVMLNRSDSMTEDVFGFDTVCKINRQKSAIDTWSYGSTSIAEEHLFVPRQSAAEGEGWLIGTAYDWSIGRTQLSVFDTMSLVDGPIASATLPYGLPLGLHGKFVATNI